jgi:hypothetical protein
MEINKNSFFDPTHQENWDKKQINDEIVEYTQLDGDLAISITKEDINTYRISPVKNENTVIEDAVYKKTVDDVNGVVSLWILNHPYDT